MVNRRLAFAVALALIAGEHIGPAIDDPEPEMPTDAPPKMRFNNETRQQRRQRERANFKRQMMKGKRQ